MDQPKGESESGPHPTNEDKSLIFQLKNASILAETNIEIMQCAVAKCPKVCISAHGIQIPSLWIPAVRLHCSGSHILTNTSCQKLNQQQVRKLMLTVCSN